MLLDAAIGDSGPLANGIGFTSIARSDAIEKNGDRMKSYMMSSVKMVRLWMTALAALSLHAVFSALVPADEPRDDAKGPPNIVMILSDDQAWTDYSMMGHPVIQTPHLDQLASRSAVFRRGYTPVPLCRPAHNDHRAVSAPAWNYWQRSAAAKGIDSGPVQCAAGADDFLCGSASHVAKVARSPGIPQHAIGQMVGGEFFQRRIHSWNDARLSTAGRETWR